MVRLETRKPPGCPALGGLEALGRGSRKWWDPVGARGMLRGHPLPPRHLSTALLLSSCHQIEEGSSFGDQTLSGFQEQRDLESQVCAESTHEGGSSYRRTWSLFNPPAWM